MTFAIHFFSSWLIAHKTTENARDCRLVTLAGVLPDTDGLGLLVDYATNRLAENPTTWYEDYHHFLLHGLPGILGLGLGMALLAQRRWRTFLLILVIGHLHLLCDLVGGRGPTINDLWSIHYLAPISRDPTWVWTGQWELNSWYNRLLAVSLFIWALYLSARHGRSFLAIFSLRLDTAVAPILQKWTRRNRHETIGSTNMGTN